MYEDIINKLVAEWEERHKQEFKKERKIRLIPLIESAKGVLFIKEILSSSDRIAAICFGSVHVQF